MNQESELLGADFGQHPNLTGQLQTFQLALIGYGIDRTDALCINRKAERQNNPPLECDGGAPSAVDACRFDRHIKRPHRRQTLTKSPAGCVTAKLATGVLPWLPILLMLPSPMTFAFGASNCNIAGLS